ncbi:hypothetical protein HN587_00125 [Candidatus Woesearchaeota archaeon]|jgi:hypothetical protein|nr:hypothetical protein [Candidatus Woesearchaeota archaeon]
MKERIETKYGFKQEGASKYVVVAPHGAGDDLQTDKLVEKIAELLGASLVVNNKIRRSQSDFNDIAAARMGGLKHEFYSDISELAMGARIHSKGEHDGEQHALVIYIHGVSDDGRIGIDLGIGAKYNSATKTYVGPKKHPKGKSNTGVVRTNTKLARNMRLSLDEKLKNDKGLRTWIGKKYPAWSKNNGIQYHKGTPDHSMQIEICRELRRSDNLDYVAQLIVESVEGAYKKL